MSANDPPSINETSDLFNSESDKLQDVVNQALKNSEKLSIAEIIKAYYQVINVTSLAKFLRHDFENSKNVEENKSLLNRMQEIEKFIGNEFNESFHPLMMSKLKELIENSMKDIKDMTTNQNEKTKEKVENQAKMYEELRQIMSTKEFVDQYNNELGNTTKN